MRISIATSKTQDKHTVVLPMFAGRAAASEKRLGLSLGGIVVPVEHGEYLNLARAAGTTDPVIIISLGARNACVAETIRRVGGIIAKRLAHLSCTRATIDMADIVGACSDDGVHAMCEGLELGAFRFDAYKTSAKRIPDCHVQLASVDGAKKAKDQLRHARIVASATNAARELGHEPANIINPITLAKRAKTMASKYGLKCTVLDDKQMARLKMGAILAVGKASETPSRLIVLEHGLKRGVKPIVLVGKAITFDTGGYSLKDRVGIVGMKYDKCGGMAVLGAMRAIAEMKLKVPVVGVIAAAENMVAGNAYRPNDIITTMSGKTVEIISTDAEGRLVLADALTYAQTKYKPKAMIDLATLTGGVVVSLGKVRAGIFCNNGRLQDKLMAAGDRTHERLWPLPIDDEYFELLKADDCDFKNSSNREAHAVQGAMFLKQFVNKNVPWAHLDIAGVADTDKALPYCPKGGTGYGVRLLCDYLETL